MVADQNHLNGARRVIHVKANLHGGSKGYLQETSVSLKSETIKILSKKKVYGADDSTAEHRASVWEIR